MEPLAQGTRIKIVDGRENFVNVTGTIVGLIVEVYPFSYIVQPDDQTLDFVTGFDEPYHYTYVYAFGNCIELI